jgi:hypothetical protein
MILVLVLVAACASPMERKYSEANVREDISEMKEAGYLDSSDVGLLGEYIVQARLENVDLDSLSYMQILRDAREEQTQRANQEREQKTRKEQLRQERLAGLVSVDLLEKGFREINSRSYITINYRITNLTDDDIRLLEGSVDHSDLSGVSILLVGLSIDEVLRAKESLIWDGTVPFDPSNDENVRFRNKTPQDLRTTWIPRKIHFTNGRVIE